MSAGTQRKYIRLRTTIIATTLCFAIVPMLFVGIVIPVQFTELYHEKTLREAENSAAGKGRALDVFLDERISLLKTIAAMYSYGEITAPGTLASLLRAVKAHSRSYIDFGVIDMEGRHVVYAGPYAVHDANYKNEGWFAETRRRGVFVSDVFTGFRNFPHIIIAVMREEGDKAWILRATIDSAVLDSLVRSARMSENGDAFVVNRQGILQTDSRFAGSMMSRASVSWAEQSSISEESRQGGTMLLAKVPLTHAPWMLVVAEDPDEHLSLIGKAAALAAGVVALALTAVSFGAWLTTRAIIRRLVEADREKAAYDATLLQSSKMAALGKMAAGVAHEINNPLMLIREHAGWIQDLLEDEKGETPRNGEEMRRAARKIEQNVDRAGDITRRLLGFARRMDPSPQNLPLRPMVEQAVAFLQNEADHRQIVLERSFSSEDIHVATDVGRLQQVILNIVDNAVDAAGKGGRVSVDTAMERDGGRATIRVRDNGPGIPPENLPHIFDPFFTTKAPGEGTGLGLSICYSIMESLGGCISAANLGQGGAEFVISLPANVPAGGNGTA
jgi:two-component system NtrC family sensor kinase